MKRASVVSFLLAVSLGCAAQSVESKKDPSSVRVTAARCQYTPDDRACKEPSADQPSSSSNSRQNSPHCPSDPSDSCRDYYPRPTHPPFIFAPESGTHAAAGVLIGFGLGAAAGAARDGDGGTRFVSAMFVGGFGALIGAVIGHGIPSHAFRRHHRRDEDLEDDVAIRPLRPVPTQTSGTAAGSATIPNQPTGP